MTPPIHAHLPYTMLEEKLPVALERRIAPEIFLSAESLERLIPEKLSAAAAALSAAALRPTIHAPFMDLNPGSFEPTLREGTRKRFRQVMDAARILRPVAMVFHPGYDRWRYGGATEKWLDLSIELWDEVREAAEEIDTLIAVENIFDEDPAIIRELLDRIGSPRFGHCFDAGHWHLFGKVTLEKWFDVLGSRIIELHLHDNSGERDDHAPLGEGTIDLPLLFTLIERHCPKAIRTIEAHGVGELERSLAWLQRLRTRP